MQFKPNPRRRALVEQYNEKYATSHQLYQRAQSVMPGGCIGAKPLSRPAPIYMDHAEGCFIYDIDGTKYIDCQMGHGAILLGHANQEIKNALETQLARGTLYSAPDELQVCVAEKLHQMIPEYDRFVFTNSGTESVFKAITLARSKTGKDGVAKFIGAYHGTYDHCLVGFSIDNPKAAYISGIPKSAINETVALPFQSQEALDLIEQHANSLAIVLLESTLGRGLFSFSTEYLAQLKAICKKHNILLCFDDILIGFRRQQITTSMRTGVHADITLLGKVVAGGLPVGIIATNAELIDECLTKQPPLLLGGTFSGNPMTIAACAAFLNYYEKNIGSVGNLSQRCSEFVKKMNQYAQEKSYPVCFTSVDTMFFYFFMNEVPETPSDLSKTNGKQSDEFLLRLPLNGVFSSELLSWGLLSFAHTDAVMAELADRFRLTMDQCFSE